MNVTAAEPHRGIAVRVVTVVCLALSCDRPSSLLRKATSDSLGVLNVVPNIRGRAVCEVDSIASSKGEFVADCDFGDGVRRTVHGDTIFAVVRKSVPPVPDSGMALLDYWNHHLRDNWESKMGRVADDLNSDRSDYADRFEAIWNDSTGVRHLLTLERRPGQAVELQYLSIDCRGSDRSKKAVACW